MRYKYSCAKCGSEVLKKPTGTVVGSTIKGLHGWLCVSCKETVKVKREHIKEKE